MGIYLLRYRAAVTEMLGMMIGMTMGMMSGIAVGFYIGAATDMFISNLVGVTVGLAFGAGFGRLGGLMGAMDGSMGGFMGGMMGGMLGVMINISPLAVWVTAAFTTVICLAIYVGLIRLVQKSSAQAVCQRPGLRHAGGHRDGEADERVSRRDGVLLRSRLQASLSTRIPSGTWCSRCARAKLPTLPRCPELAEAVRQSL